MTTAHPEAEIQADVSANIFTPEELLLIQGKQSPKHVAIIMDGNRRWAKQQSLSPMIGHWEGAEALTDVVRAASELGIETLTVYSFSTENWGRSDGEIEDLMRLFECYLIQKREVMLKDGVRLDAIGDLSRMPASVLGALQETKRMTAHCNKINLVLALNYGGRDEIRRAISKILIEHEKKKITPQELTEEYISQYLDTNPWGDPDLLIRTSGEFRVSNFLLWQISYAEIHVTDVLWPDFSPKHLLEAVANFQARTRRLGAGR